MAQLFSPPRFIAVDGAGNPYANAKLYFYQTGTTTLQTVYSDSSATVALTNPVVADANGLFAAIYLSSSNLYKAVLQDSSGNTIWTTDPLSFTQTVPTAVYTPQGRLTLASGSPVMTSNQLAATTIYYTPYVGNQIPVYDGTSFSGLTFTELSNLTAQSSTGSAGPAAVTTNSNYDLFVWSNNGVATLTRGPAWTSDTARGTGAGTTELTRVYGVLVNANAITNGPAANKGTYVGTVRSNGSSQIDWQQGAIAANGTAALLGVWNMYNRVAVSGVIGDTTDSWTYAGAAFRAANGSNTMRCSFVQGWTEDYVTARYDVPAAASGAIAINGIGLNSTTAAATNSTKGVWNPGVTTAIITIGATAAAQVLGWNYLQALENNSVGTATFYGDGGGLSQNGLSYSTKY